MDPSPQQPRRRLTGAIVPALAAAGLAGLGALLIVGQLGAGDHANTLAPKGCLLDAQSLSAFGGPIDLVDPNGRRVTEADLSSGPALVYFGFTHCPDICPTTLYAMAQALGQMGPQGFDIQPVMISLDPERDTTDVMDAYVGAEGFPEGLIGLTGTADQVKAAADAFKVYYRRAPIEGQSVDYNIDHSSLLYVMDEKWRARGVIPTVNAAPADIAACVRLALSGTGA
jgi:protein SCO1